MQRLTIQIRKPGQDGKQTIVLGRLGSMLLTLVMVLVVIAMAAIAIVFGYLIMGMVLAAFLITVVVAMLRGALQGLRR